jgi:uncharacterized FlaG/YvyC family protein
MVLTQVQTAISTPIIPTAPAGDCCVEQKKDLDNALSNKGTTKKSLQNLDLEGLSQKLNQKAQEEKLDISFEYDKELNKVYINVVDKHSGKVIQKLPSEEAMKFAKSIKESLGKLLDRRA